MSKEALQEMASTAAYNGWVAQRAQLALDMVNQFEAGEISEEEYKELMTDLARTDEIEEEAVSLEMKTALVTAIYGVAQLA
jgi:polyhydroxyalkanoate synthesis regulator phasin